MTAPKKRETPATLEDVEARFAQFKSTTKYVVSAVMIIVMGYVGYVNVQILTISSDLRDAIGTVSATLDLHVKDYIIHPTPGERQANQSEIRTWRQSVLDRLDKLERQGRKNRE